MAPALSSERGSNSRGMAFGELQQVPQIAVDIAENRHRAVIMDLRLAHEFDTGGIQPGEIPGKIIGVEKHEHTPAGLVADKRFLLRPGRPRQHDRGTLSALGPHHHPAFVLFSLIGVFDEIKAEHAAVKANGFVIIAHHESNMGNGLAQIVSRIPAGLTCLHNQRMGISVP